MTLLLTAEQVRGPKYLNVSERGLRVLLKAGLPYIKVGKRKMFPPDEIKDWISQHTSRCHIGSIAG